MSVYSATITTDPGTARLVVARSEWTTDEHPTSEQIHDSYHPDVDAAMRYVGVLGFRACGWSRLLDDDGMTTSYLTVLQTTPGEQPSSTSLRYQQTVRGLFDSLARPRS